MPSHNILLGSGPVTEEPKVESHHGGTPAIAWRYHESCPEGRLLKTAEDIAKYDALGWVNTPGKIFLLPGHEQVYADYQASLVKKTEAAPPSENAVPELTPEQIEDARKADELLKANQDLEAKRLKGLEPAERFICDVEGCGKEFEKAQGLRMHKMSAHKIKKVAE